MPLLDIPSWITLPRPPTSSERVFWYPFTTDPTLQQGDPGDTASGTGTNITISLESTRAGGPHAEANWGAIGAPALPLTQVTEVYGVARASTTNGQAFTGLYSPTLGNAVMDYAIPVVNGADTSGTYYRLFTGGLRVAAPDFPWASADLRMNYLSSVFWNWDGVHPSLFSITDVGFLIYAQVGKIIVEKVTDPPGSPQSFDFTPSWASPFSLTDGQNADSGWMITGNFSVHETAVTGWAPTVVTARNESGAIVPFSPALFNLPAGQVITVTFTNERLTVPLVIPVALTVNPPTPPIMIPVTLTVKPSPTHILTMNYLNGWNPPLMMTLSGEWVPSRQARRWNIDPIPTRAMAMVKRTLATPVDQRVNYRQFLMGSSRPGPVALLYMKPGVYDDLGLGYESKYRIAYVSEKPSQEFPAGGRVLTISAYSGHAIGKGMLYITPFLPEPDYDHDPYQRTLDSGKAQIPGSAPVTHIDGGLKADSEFFTLEFSNGGKPGAWFQLIEMAIFGKPKLYTA